MKQIAAVWKKTAFCFLGLISVIILLSATTAVFFLTLERSEPAAAQAASSASPAEGTQSSLDTWEFTGQLEDWRLLLVNNTVSMPEDKLPDLETIGSIQVDRRIVDDLQAMLEAASGDGVELTLSSGYRSAERQQELFQKAVEDNRFLGMNLEMAEAVAAESVARTGHSEHNTGLAIDFNGVLETFDETPEYRWLQRHAYEYGFVLRYPQEKSELTGIRFEPWHFRYVGREHAEKMRLLNLCLEEYVTYLTAQQSRS